MALRSFSLVIAVGVIVATGCNDKSAPSTGALEAQTPPKMKMTTLEILLTAHLRGRPNPCLSSMEASCWSSAFAKDLPIDLLSLCWY